MRLARGPTVTGRQQECLGLPATPGVCGHATGKHVPCGGWQALVGAEEVDGREETRTWACGGVAVGLPTVPSLNSCTT